MKPNRNEKIAKMDFAKADPEAIRVYFVQQLDQAGILAELIKADDTGELADFVLTHNPNLPLPELRLIAKAIQDPLHFANLLDLGLKKAKSHLSYFERQTQVKSSVSPLGNGPGQLGGSRVNPNLKASEPGQLLAYEKMDKAQQVEAKRLCARHCKKAGRAGCTYCNGMGFAQRVRQSEKSNQPKFKVNGTERILE